MFLKARNAQRLQEAAVQFLVRALDGSTHAERPVGIAGYYKTDGRTVYAKPTGGCRRMDEMPSAGGYVLSGAIFNSITRNSFHIVA